MTKALRSIKDETKQLRVVDRRLKGATKGLGYWAAVDYVKKYGSSKKSSK